MGRFCKLNLGASVLKIRRSIVSKSYPNSMKRILLSSFCIFGAASIGLAEEWNQYRGPSSDGVTSESVGKTDWSDLTPVWKVDTPLGFSSFAVDGDHAYTLIQREIDGNPMEICLALKKSDGSEAWAQPLGFAKYDGGGNAGAGDNKGGDGPRSTPTVAGGKVYILDAQITLHCLNASDGSPLWKKSILKDFDGNNIRWQNAASPLIDGDQIFVAGGGSGQSLIAFNANDGSVAWKTGDEKMTHATPIAATMHGERQVIFFTQSGVIGVRASDGEERWKYDFPFKVSTAASPVVYEDIVYCSAGYGVGAGAAKVTKSGDSFSAEEIWRKENDLINHWSTPVVKDGYLYGMFSFKKYGSGPLACVDIRTGEMKWQEAGFGPGHLIMAGDQLIASGDQGQLVLVNPSPKEYDEVTRIDVLAGKSWSTPILSGGKIYARSSKEAVCLDVSR